MEQEEKKPRYKWLAVMVGVVAAIAGGLYLYQFGSNGLSPKSEDWANFATYISGTVGVAAVVATLIAFVITLRQQKRLIDSQDEMLKEQRRQIVISEKQSNEVMRNNKIDLAFKSTSNFFDFYEREFNKGLQLTVLPYQNDGDLYNKFCYNFDNEHRNVIDLYHNPLRLGEVFENSEIKPVLSYMKRVFKTVDSLYRFVCSQIELAPFLKDYFDIKLSIDSSYDNKFYIHCYQAYLIGVDDNLYKQGVVYLDLQDSYHGCGNDDLEKWQELGESIRKRLSQSGQSMQN